jgi:uncharacterized membrane protein
MGPSRHEVEEQIGEHIDRLRSELADIDRAERKDALKGAFKELMQEQLAKLGGWTLAAIGTAVVMTLLYIVFYVAAVKTGWTPPHQ